MSGPTSGLTCALPHPDFTPRTPKQTYPDPLLAPGSAQTPVSPCPPHAKPTTTPPRVLGGRNATLAPAHPQPSRALPVSAARPRAVRAPAPASPASPRPARRRPPAGQSRHGPAARPPPRRSLPHKARPEQPGDKMAAGRGIT